MKHTAYKIRDKVGCITWFQQHPFPKDKILEQTPLYTAHEIAEFVVTLSHDIVGKPATTEQLVVEETYLHIADKIEKESQK